MTKIEWTQMTWNPVVGCSVVSPGCTNCYAMKLAPKLAGNSNTPQYVGTVQNSKGGPVWTGKVALAEKALLEPLKRKKPTTYFVNSMGDLFHENIPYTWIDQVFAVMALCPQHTFQVLTKRSKRMRDYFANVMRGHRNWIGEATKIAGKCHLQLDVFGPKPQGPDCFTPLPNVWLGVSAEDQKRANERVPDLLRTPAAIRFVSAEPLLGPVDFTRWFYGPDVPCNGCPKDVDCECGCERRADLINEIAPGSIDWIIVGGESGHSARPMHPDWARQIRDDCQAAGTKFFFKQWGEHVTAKGLPGNTLISHVFEDGYQMCRLGKKAAGRLLDGREWNEVPG